jgi:hypothetical protein
MEPDGIAHWVGPVNYEMWRLSFRKISDVPGRVEVDLLGCSFRFASRLRIFTNLEGLNRTVVQ